MTTGDAEILLRNLRRDIGISVATRALFAGIFGLGLVAASLSADAGQRLAFVFGATMIAALGWAVLSAMSVGQLRAASQATYFIAAGQSDLAEQQLRQALGSFSIYANAKLMLCHNLAVIAHGRGDYAAAAKLCDGVLRFPGRLARQSRSTTRMLLADCRLLLNDLAGASAVLEGLRFDDARLSLAQRQMLLPIVVRRDVLAGRFSDAAEHLAAKTKLAEMMDAPRAALVHALLAHACEMVHKAREAAYLASRAALYHDLAEFVPQFPMLASLVSSRQQT